jgi:hypothetical protein
LSGQRRWMDRAATETEDTVEVRLVPLDLENPQAIEATLARLEPWFENLDPKKERHIYCELPWSCVEDGEVIEIWLSTRLSTPGNQWNVSFVLLLTPDADRLPEECRRQIEQYARESQSAVIVTRTEGVQPEIAWLGTDQLDLGDKLEVFEEDLWPEPEGNHGEGYPAGDQYSDLEVFSFPMSGERTSFEDLLNDIARGIYGNVWGAEAYWSNERSEFEGLTLTQNHVFFWSSNRTELVQQAPRNGALLQIAGVGLKIDSLRLALRSQNFC